MMQIPTLLLKLVILFTGMIVLALSIYWLPWQANVMEGMYPEFSYLKYPLLIGIYMTSIPFFLALYQAFKLLDYIDKKAAFSELSINALVYIKYCALIISSLYVIGFIILIIRNAGNPGILLIGLIIIFTSMLIAVFSAVLQMLLRNAIGIKEENDLII